MSIRDEIKLLIEGGRLFLIEPVLESVPIRRTLAVSQAIHDRLVGPWEDQATAERFGWLRADLEVFVKGDKIPVCLQPYAHKTAYMGRLDKPEDEVWDIRSRDPDPGIRVFGRFADVDLFVALHWAPRSIEWDDRNALGDRNALEWHFAIIECQKRWREFFPQHRPVHSEHVENYISEGAFLT